MLIQTLCLEGVGVLNARVVGANQDVSLAAFGRRDLVQRKDLSQRVGGGDGSPVLVETGEPVAADSFHPRMVSRLRASP